MITMFGYLKGDYREDRERLFSVAIGDRTRSNGFYFQQGKFRLDTRWNC